MSRDSATRSPWKILCHRWRRLVDAGLLTDVPGRLACVPTETKGERRHPEPSDRGPQRRAQRNAGKPGDERRGVGALLFLRGQCPETTAPTNTINRRNIQLHLERI
jgi:hypothetical protein